MVYGHDWGFVLIILSDVGRQPSSRQHHSLGLAPVLDEQGESELSTGRHVCTLSALDCGCDWLLQLPAALTMQLLWIITWFVS